MGLINWIGKCCGKRSRTESRTIPDNIEPAPPQVQVQNNTRMARKKFNLNRIITSKVDKENIMISNFTPKKSSRHLYKFRCSIWYSFFSNVLECSECHNYICVFDLEKYLISMNKAQCPFWSSHPVKFNDIDPNQQPKHYFSDSESSQKVNSGNQSKLNGLVYVLYFRSNSKT